MLTRKLARFVVETDASTLPGELFERARDALCDTVGVMVIGSREEPARIAQQWVEEAGARPIASVCGTSLMTTPVEAAFANGVAAHALDFDDSMPTLRGHPSAPVLSALLAVGESTGASGTDMLAAYALGVEIAAKLGRAMGHGHYLRGWHATATMGAFSSVAGVSRLMKLSTDQLCTAFGIAASMSAGLVRNFGSMTKPLHVGHAARTGVTAAWLARSGFTADDAIFDGERSFLATYENSAGEPLEALVEQLGDPWEIITPGPYVKRWPCCHATHRTIANLLAWRESEGLRPEDITEVTVGFLPGADNALIKSDPQTGLEGKFSIEYVAAAALVDGRVTLESFTDSAVHRPEVRKLMERVRRLPIPSDKTYSGVTGYNDISVHTADRVLEVREERAVGSSEWPLSAEDRRAKFLDCTVPVLGAPTAAKLLGGIDRVVGLPDIRELTEHARKQELQPAG